MRTADRPSAPLVSAGGGPWLASWRWVEAPRHRFQLRGETSRAGDESRGVLFDGVLFNRDEVVARLGADPAGDDATLVRDAFARWGEETLRHVKGIYSLLFWDDERDLFLAARDPFGIYPLFYADAGPAVLFSPSIPELLKQPGVSAAFNLMTLADHLCDHWRDLEGTYYESVRRVPPACALRIDRGGRRLVRHWDPAPAGAPVRWVRDDELGQFDGLLEQAVGRCLRIGPAAVFLSGGLDSVSVAGVAADLCRREGRPPPRALSLVFPDPLCDEEAVQKSVAAGLGMPQDLLAVSDATGGRGLVEAGLEISARMPMPLLNVWLPAYLTVAEQGVRRGCRVILSGSGGDEWLTVGASYAADLLRGGDFRGLHLLWSSAAGSYRVPPPSLAYDFLWTFGLRLWLGEVAGEVVRRWAPRGFRARRDRLIRKGIPRWVLPELGLRRAFVRRAERGIERPGPDSYYVREGQKNLHRPLLALEMEENFEIGLRLGARLLHPYWDADLVEFLLRVPPPALLKGGRSKGLVRHSLAKRFPGLGFEAQQKAVAVPYFRFIMKAEGEATRRRFGVFDPLAALGLVDAVALRRSFDDALARGDNEVLARIWSAMALAAWVVARS